MAEKVSKLIDTYFNLVHRYSINPELHVFLLMWIRYEVRTPYSL